MEYFRSRSLTAFGLDVSELGDPHLSTSGCSTLAGGAAGLSSYYIHVLGVHLSGHPWDLLRLRQE